MRSERDVEYVDVERVATRHPGLAANLAAALEHSISRQLPPTCDCEIFVHIRKLEVCYEGEAVTRLPDRRNY